MAPRFSDVDYWDARFRQDERGFDWLLPAAALRPWLAPALHAAGPAARVLHFGPGSSALALDLRALLPDAPQRIVNVDFSRAAVELGARNEAAAFDEGEGQRMRWLCLDLTSLAHVHRLLAILEPPTRFGVVVDKSSADAVACGDDVLVNFGAFESPPPSDPQVGLVEEWLQPVRALALHMAVLTQPKATWISVSYSQDRFSFLEHGHDAADDAGAETSVFDLRQYWVLAQKEPLVEQTHTPDPSTVNVVHRPQVPNWVYVLTRTDNELRIKGIWP